MKKFLPFVVLLLNCIYGSSMNYIGGGIETQKLNDNNFKVSLNAFLDCSSTNVPEEMILTVTPNPATGTGSATFNLKKSLIFGEDVTSQLCAKLVSSCLDGNSQIGIKKYIYESTLELVPRGVSYKLSVKNGNNSKKVTTVDNSAISTLSFYVESYVRPEEAPVNFGNIFNDLPVIYSCVNNPSIYVPKVNIPEGIEYRFSVVNTSVDANKNISYLDGYSGKSPVGTTQDGSFSVDSLTGQISFTPSKQDVGVFTLRVRQIKDGKEIGRVLRDYSIYSESCTNNAPVFQSLAPISINQGEPLEIQLTATDADFESNDITIIPLDVPEGATLVDSSNLESTTVKGKFKASGWLTWYNNDFVGTKKMRFAAVDNCCPNPGRKEFSFDVTVNPSSDGIVLQAAATKTNQIAPAAAPAPPLSLSPGTTVCLGTVLTPLLSNGKVIASAQWMVKSGLRFTIVGTTINYAPLASGYYTIRVIDVDKRKYSLSIYITVNPLPVVQAGSDAVDQKICSGYQFSLKANSPEDPNITYAWSPSHLVTNPNIAFPKASINATTEFTVQATNKNGCINSSKIVITAIPLPIVNAGADRSICLGQKVQLNATTNNGGSFSWTPLGSLSDFMIPNPIASPTVTTDYTVRNLDRNFCANTDIVRVTVRSTVTEAVSVCEGASVGLDVPAGGIYEWSRTDGLSSTTSGYPTLTPAASGQYKVNINNSAGNCFVQKVFDVIVNSKPTINAGSDKSLCNGLPVNLQATGGVSYDWYLETYYLGKTDNNAGSNIFSITLPASNTLKVVGKSDKGCTNEDFVYVNVIPLPIVNAGPDVSICSGGSAQLNATVNKSYNGLSWTNGQTLSSVYTLSPIAKPATTTTYELGVVDVNGCYNKDEVTVTVMTNPTWDVYGPAQICEGSQAFVTGYGMNSATWYPTTGVSDPNAPNPALSPTTTTEYTVNVLLSNGCYDSKIYNLTVVSNPIVNAGLDQEVAVGSSALNLVGSPAGGTWSGNGVTSAGVFTPSTVGTNELTYSFTNSNGCSGSDKMIVNVTGGLTIALSADNLVSCATWGIDGSTGTVVHASIGAGNYSYLWYSPNGGYIVDPSSLDTRVSIGHDGLPGKTYTYTFQVTNLDNGKITEESINIQFLPTPYLGHPSYPGPTYSGSPVRLSVTALYSTPKTYQWTVLEGYSLSSINTQSTDFYPHGTGFYSVPIRVVDYNGCAHARVLMFSYFGATREDDESSQFAVNKVEAFPNPFENETSITIKGMRDEFAEVIIYDSKGVEVQRISKANGDSVLSVGGDLTPGPYQVKIVYKNEVRNIKLLKL